MVLVVNDFALDGNPVGMHIKHRHEHRQLDAVAVQEFVFIDLLKGHYCAVNTRHNGGAVAVVSLEVAARQPEEIQYQQEQDGH